MKVNYEAITSKLQEIVNLQAEIELQEIQYKLLLKTDTQFEVLKEARLKIKYLKTELTAKEKSAITSF
jgi:hypothetical protein